jgi:hypothetical protein
MCIIARRVAASTKKLEGPSLHHSSRELSYDTCSPRQRYNDSFIDHFPRRCRQYVRQPWASRLRTSWLLDLALVLIVSMVFCGLAPNTKAEESGHRLHHEGDYRHWKQPGTSISCCWDHDCGPVKAELRQGQWFALRQSAWFEVPDEKGPGEWLPLRRSEWIEIPDAKIILERSPTIEGGHLCYSSGKVICFVAPNTGG